MTITTPDILNLSLEAVWLVVLGVMGWGNLKTANSDSGQSSEK